MNNDVCAKINRADKVAWQISSVYEPNYRRLIPHTTHAKGIVHNQRNLVRVGNLRDVLKRADIVLGISNAFHVDSFGVLVDSCLKCGSIVGSNKLDVNPEFLEQH